DPGLLAVSRVLGPGDRLAQAQPAMDVVTELLRLVREPPPVDGERLGADDAGRRLHRLAGAGKVDLLEVGAGGREHLGRRPHPSEAVRGDLLEESGAAVA